MDTLIAFVVTAPFLGGCFWLMAHEQGISTWEFCRRMCGPEVPSCSR